MKIYNTTTGKVESLTIIDLKTGCEWTADLISAGNLFFNEDLEMTEMSNEDFEWWSNLIELKTSNEERIAEIELNIGDDDDLEQFRTDLMDCYGNDLDTDEERVKLFLDNIE